MAGRGRSIEIATGEFASATSQKAHALHAIEKKSRCHFACFVIATLTAGLPHHDRVP